MQGIDSQRVTCEARFWMETRYLRDFAHLAMETSVLLPLAVVALVLLDRIASSSSKRSLFSLGCILALIGLARLDAALLAILIGILAVRQHGEGRVSVAVVFSPGALAGTLYLGVNKVIYGSWMSVSGSIKASGFGLNTLFAKQLFLLSDPLGFRSPWGLFLIFFVLSFVVLFAKQSRSSAKAVSIFVILFTILQLSLSSWRMWFWYAYPAVLFCVTGLPLLLQKLINTLRFPKTLLSIATGTLTVLAFFLSVLWGWHYGDGNLEDFRVRNMLIAEELNESMEDSTLIAMGDRAGSFAYFFRGGVVQMEGLAGSAELVEYIQQGKLQEFLTNYGVDYVLSWTGPGYTTDYSSWDLLVPDRAQSLSTPNRVTVYREYELQKWPGSSGTVFLWLYSGGEVAR